MGNEVDLQRPFADVYKALDLKTQRKAMRSAMRKEGNRVKKVAVSTLHSKAIGPGTKRSLDKGIYVRTYPNRFGLGFMVTVKPFGKKGIHENRRSLEKPVLMWAEDGTRLRHVGKRTSSFFSKSRGSGNRVRQYRRDGHQTGKMPGYRFLAETEEKTAGSVENNLFDSFQSNIEKAAKKQGLM